MAIDYAAGRKLLDEVFSEVEKNVLEGNPPGIPEALIQHFDAILSSATQAYRETLVGCVVARIQDRQINIRLPYKNQGADAYNGRTLDEKVINPFLHEHRIPCSKGPFLSAFRRSIRFDETTKVGLRDKEGYHAFLSLVSYLVAASAESNLHQFLCYLLYRFAKLREESDVPLARLGRMSLKQLDDLVGLLMNTPSGGRLPVVIVVAAFRTVKEFFEKDWTIDFQGINVADGPSGAGGDVTIREAGQVFLAAEITERPLDRSRVVTTFNTKIAPHGIGDYLFFVSLKSLSSEAVKQTRQYFAQGNDVNFIDIRSWTTALLATMGKRGRDLFNTHLLALMDDPEMPRQLKMAWNGYIEMIISGGSSSLS